MDAANIDLKGFTDGFYKNLCSGKLAPVLETLEYLKRQTFAGPK
jgi:pyruvate formate lyase activating enzyme